ncbi:hypothetical protein CBI38_37390 (plasmid) [Rhodococcus oxybenzonivorans]|uniref:Antitoxin VbhA domain-containing protein n=2 Tax=Rhodococcus oxybenzonivorans TaxID=1990687 RepID=A0A2S2C8D4_9NOCA|nr:hypothetical protein CBI38_37390 [Rhodococcus oxybenzonivorans]
MEAIERIAREGWGPMTTAHKVTTRTASRGVEESIQFAAAGVRLASGTVTEADKAAARRVARGVSTPEQELAAFRQELEL